MILADTNVLLDVLTGDPIWVGWSRPVLESAAAEDSIAINDVIYSELSTRYATPEALDCAIANLALDHAPIPKTALFLAGKAFLRYRKQGGTKTGVLSDLFIGAHAAVAECPLITRDTRRIAGYFPSVRLITPA